MAEDSNSKLHKAYSEVWLDVKNKNFNLDITPVNSANVVAELVSDMQDNCNTNNADTIKQITEYYKIIDEAHYLRNLVHITRVKEIPDL